MKTDKREIFKIILICLWSIGAFLIVISPLAKAFFYQLAFRNVYIPLYYWIWVLAGAIFIRKIGEKNIGEFLIAAIIFHLIANMAQLLANNAIYKYVSVTYLLYIYAAICVFTAFFSLWALMPFFEKRLYFSISRLPLAAAPFLSLFFSIYHSSKNGFYVFSICVILLVVSIRFKDSFMKVTDAFFAFFRSMRNNKKAAVIFIFTLAFLFRALFAFIVITKTQENYITASDDGISYDEVARNIAESPENAIKILVAQPWPPCYMVFLSIIYMLFGRNFYVTGLIQSVLGAVIAVLIFLIGRKIYGNDTGIVAGIIVALSQPLIFSSAVLGTEALYIPLLVSATFLLLSALFFARRKSTLKILLSGALFSLAAVTLGVITLFPFLVFLFILFAREQHTSIKRRALVSLQFLTAFIAFYLLIKAVYVCEAGSWQSNYEHAGGSGYWSQGSSYGYERDPDNRKFAALGINPFERPLRSIKIMWENRNEVLAISMEVFPQRIKNFFLWGNFGFFDPVFLVNASRAPNIFGVSLEFYTMLFSIAGFIFCFRSFSKASVVLIIMLISYYVFIHAIVFMIHTVRYSCPVKPFLALFLAHGMNLGYRKLKGMKTA